jgi:type III restriction enzyme
MKLIFKEQDYQKEAVKCVVGCFVGQKKGGRRDDIVLDKNFLFKDSVFSNKKLNDLSKDEILKNLNEVQYKQNLKLTKKLDNLNFTIEMETGTGKTYVYIRTILELNEKYG